MSGGSRAIGDNAEGAARARAEAVEGFAALLGALRDSVGAPSFREMSGRSRAISHTTLHEAAQGNRLPSWSTTVEFVKACGADPGKYRARWEHADRVVRSVSALHSPLHSAAPAGDPVARPDATAALPAAAMADRRAGQVAVDAEPAAGDDASARAPRARRRRRYALVVAAAVGAVAVLAVAVGLRTESSGNSQGGAGRPGNARFSPADCPVRQSNPPAAPPAHQKDASEFIADVTVPDCSHVHRGQTVTKVWRLKNVGTVPWVGYSLHRVDLPQQRDQCQTIPDVPIDDTKPGDPINIRTEVTAPKNPSFCFVRFKMLDAAGNLAFPGSRPVNFQIIVD